MLPFLASEPTTQTTAAAAEWHLDWAAWAPSTRELLLAGAVSIGIILGVLIVSAIFRTFLTRRRLGKALWVLGISTALYVAVFVMRPSRLAASDDVIAYWLHRGFAACLLFAGFRVLDRLLILTFLTRSGKLPVPRFVHQILQTVICLFLILVYGSQAFGWDVSAFLAGSAVVSIVLGLALQETLGNFFSGMVMQASSPFTLGDWIVCAGVEGRVVDMTWRAVTVHTVEDNYVLIPNSTIAKELITNFHTPTLRTARSVRVGMDYTVPPNQARAVLMSAITDTDGVLKDPAPHVYLEDLADGAMVYRLEFWIDQPVRHLKTEDTVRSNAWYRIRQAGFGIPMAATNIDLNHVNASLDSAARTETERRIASLAGVPLLAPLSRDQISRLADQTRDVRLAPGQVLFRQGESGDSLYILQSGAVDVLLDQPDGSSKAIATIPAPDFFGEMSALTGQPRSATIRAAGNTGDIVLVEVTKAQLSELFSADESIMVKVSHVLAQRTADREARLREADVRAAAPERVAEVQTSLLGRMRSFFNLFARPATA